MSKKKTFRRSLTAFVEQLTKEELREQLISCYIQMERCRQVLRGYDVQPVFMVDNGFSSDLELFYQCKKVREELDLLNQQEKERKGDRTTNGADVDNSETIKRINDFAEKLEKFREIYSPFRKRMLYVFLR